MFSQSTLTFLLIISLYIKIQTYVLYYGRQVSNMFFAHVTYWDRGGICYHPWRTRVGGEETNHNTADSHGGGGEADSCEGKLAVMQKAEPRRKFRKGMR